MFNYPTVTAMTQYLVDEASALRFGLCTLWDEEDLCLFGPGSGQVLLVKSFQ